MNYGFCTVWSLLGMYNVKAICYFKSVADLRIIRFVNGMVDAEQQGAYAISIATLATKLYMPLWFVELRHAGTHEQLPSLQVLRNGCRHVRSVAVLEFQWDRIHFDTRLL